MLNTIDVRESHKNYEQSSEGHKKAIGHAYTACIKVLIDEGYDVAGDDRAEELIAAIHHYITRCHFQGYGF